MLDDKKYVNSLENKISELQKEIFMLRKILDTIDANIYWKDINGKYLGMNKNNVEALQINNIEKAIGKTEIDLLDDTAIAKSVLENDLKVIKNKATKVYEEQYPMKNYKMGFCLSTKSVLIDNQNEIIGLVGVSVDITDRKKLEEEVKQKDALKTQFIENFSHDIKVPINALVGRTQLLKLIGYRAKNEDLIEAAEGTENSAMVLDTLFTQMKDIVVHEQFEKKPYNTRFNLLDIIKSEIDVAKGSILPNKKIDFNFSLSDDLSIEVNSDNCKLSQIIRNLLSNAVKYTDEGSINIDAEIVKQTDNQIDFKFTVTDTGIGINQDYQESIFEKFNRADITSHDHNRHGMGVGLYIIKNNLNMLGGNINFESHPGQGSKFTIEVALDKC